MLNSAMSVHDIWSNIQHIDIYFDDCYMIDWETVGLVADYDKKDNTIYFRDEDHTLLFYVSNKN